MKVNRFLVLHRAARPRSSESGWVLIAVTFALLVLVGFVGLAIDTSHLEHVRRRMQTAADSGALGGAWELARGRSEAEIIAAANNDANINGFPAGADTAITVNHPPASGFYAGSPDAVEVIIRQPNQRVFFMGAIGGGRGAVAARAVAHLGSGNGCIFVLNPTARNSLVINGGSDLHMGCGIIVDSNNNTALNVNGCSATVDATLIGVTGGVNDNCNVLHDPPPVTGLLPAPDPLRDLVAPAVGPCDAAHMTQTKITGGTVTLTPGVYCGGAGDQRRDGGILPRYVHL